MKRKLFYAIALSLTLSSPAWGQGAGAGWSQRLSGGNNLARPGVDIYRIQCSSPINPGRGTELMARVSHPSEGGPESMAVGTICVDPPERIGRGDLERLQIPERRGSEWSSVRDCRKAVVIVTCDHGAPCGGRYEMDVHCENSRLDSPTPENIPIFDR